MDVESFYLGEETRALNVDLGRVTVDDVFRRTRNRRQAAGQNVIFAVLKPEQTIDGRVVEWFKSVGPRHDGTE